MIVSVTAYNRPGYLLESLASWRVAWRPWDRLILNVDPGSEEVRQAAHAVDWTSADVHENPYRYGALGNPWHALMRGFSTGADFVVVGEDDAVVSPDVLAFFAHCSEVYRHDQSVFAICPFTYFGDCSNPAHLHRDTFTSTVWGTWHDRWEESIRDTWDFDYRHSGWDHHFRNTVQNGRVCIRPCIARSQHIGREGGTHCEPQDFEQLQSKTFDPSVNLSGSVWHE